MQNRWVFRWDHNRTMLGVEMTYLGRLFRHEQWCLEKLVCLW